MPLEVKWFRGSKFKGSRVERFRVHRSEFRVQRFRGFMLMEGCTIASSPASTSSNRSILILFPFWVKRSTFWVPGSSLRII
jgi:hypothetical protein